MTLNHFFQHKYNRARWQSPFHFQLLFEFDILCIKFTGNLSQVLMPNVIPSNKKHMILAEVSEALIFETNYSIPILSMSVIAI